MRWLGLGLGLGLGFVFEVHLADTMRCAAIRHVSAASAAVGAWRCVGACDVA